jgi:hypothetical protein
MHDSPTILLTQAPLFPRSSFDWAGDEQSGLVSVFNFKNGRLNSFKKFVPLASHESFPLNLFPQKPAEYGTEQFLLSPKTLDNTDLCKSVPPTFIGEAPLTIPAKEMAMTENKI